MKARVQRTANKAIVLTFFDNKGMVYTHSVPTGQMINAEYYKSVLETLMREHTL